MSDETGVGLTIPCPLDHLPSGVGVGGATVTTCILCGETSESTALNRHRRIVVHELVARLIAAVATPAPHDDTLLTLRQAAAVLSVSYSTLTKWTARGEFCPQAFKLPNGEYRVRYRDLIRWALDFRAPEEPRSRRKGTR